MFIILTAYAIRASALTGEGIESLTVRIGNALVPDCPAPDTPIPVCERQIAELPRALELLSAGGVTVFREQLQICLNG